MEEPCLHNNSVNMHKIIYEEALVGNSHQIVPLKKPWTTVATDSPLGPPLVIRPKCTPHMPLKFKDYV